MGNSQNYNTVENIDKIFGVANHKLYLFHDDELFAELVHYSYDRKNYLRLILNNELYVGNLSLVNGVFIFKLGKKHYIEFGDYCIYSHYGSHILLNPSMTK